MRRLIYIPIIHLSADLGEIAGEVNKKGQFLVGNDRWRTHLDTIMGFWDAVARYLDNLEAENLKIYQDGLMINGTIAQRIVDDGVKRKSKNYEIISRLLDRGARLIRTEDFPLVKKEYDRVMAIVRADRITKKIMAVLAYRFQKKRILRKRDLFIARVIDKTLKEGETGILFLGADHDILPKLPKDIKITELKKREKLREYQRRFSSEKSRGRVAHLAEYLTSQIEYAGPQPFTMSPEEGLT